MQPPASDPASRAASIRIATSEDIPAVRELLTLRDSRPWDDASTAWFVQNLDPERCMGWLAFVGAKPVGLSTLYRRELRGPFGAIRSGYWANLFVHPEHRDQMIYPRLPMMLLAAARELKIDLIYGATRQKNVAFGHTRIGFTTIGTFPLLVKPLRPARLIGKFKGWPAVSALSPALDGLWSVGLAAQRMSVPSGVRVEEVPVSSTAVEELVALLGATARDRIVDTWTPETFRYRYRQTREGTRYVLLVARRGGALVGGLVYRVAERDPDIRAGVVMDVIVGPGHERSMLSALAEAERLAAREGCELMMFLSGGDPALAAAFASYGYRTTSESYDLQIGPRQVFSTQSLVGDLRRWRFAFGDHDAF